MLNQKTIDEILKQEVSSLIGVRPRDIHPHSATQQCIDAAKQAIKEAILTEVIGEDKHYERIETPAGSFICENCGVYTGYPDDCKCEARNELRRQQRQCLDAWLELEDTSNE